jgi:hypothetical protein
MRCSGGSNSGVETIVGETANTEHYLVTLELADDSLGVVGASTRRTGETERLSSCATSCSFSRRSGPI